MAAMLTVRVTPNASRDEVAGEAGGVIRIRLRAPAVEGKANAALVRFVAECLGVRASSVRIVRGDTSRNKVLAIEGMEGPDAAQRLVDRS